jgi:hypothetical protein
VLEQLVKLLQQLATMLSAMNTSGGGPVGPPMKHGDHIGGAPQGARRGG